MENLTNKARTQLMQSSFAPQEKSKSASPTGISQTRLLSFQKTKMVKTTQDLLKVQTNKNLSERNLSTDQHVYA